MITDILLKGSIKLAIAYISQMACAKVMSDNLKNDLPEELHYGYLKKTKKKNYIKSILSDALFFVPVIGTVLLVVNVLIYGGVTAFCAFNKNNSEFKKQLRDKLDLRFEMPDERLKKLQKGQTMHKDMVDSLKIDGLNNKEIKEFVKSAKKEDPFLNSDNSKEINKNMQRVENLKLLDPIKDMLKNPKKAYSYTLNKKIQYANINGDTLSIGVSKLDKNNSDNDNSREENMPKMYVKKFKLR